MRFDAQTFEKLSGIELARYAVELMKERIEECDFLPYFEKTASQMDASHLELAVAMLGKIASAVAYHKVAGFLEHPNFSVRFVATKIIADMQAVDEVIMRCIVESLRRHEGDPTALVQELCLVLDRPANDQARQVVSAYRSKPNVSR